jgi:hypothetical protein
MGDRPLPPVFLRNIGTDEHRPPPLDEAQRMAIRKTVARGADDAARAGRALGDYWSSRLGTAAGLRAINEQAGQTFFEVPTEATLEQAAANEVFRGTDATWYGPTQPVIDALRVFQISDELCARHGYPKLTDEIRAKILGRNAARFYDIDLAAARRSAMTDNLAWTRHAIKEGLSV